MKNLGLSLTAIGILSCVAVLGRADAWGQDSIPGTLPVINLSVSLLEYDYANRNLRNLSGANFTKEADKLRGRPLGKTPIVDAKGNVVAELQLNGGPSSSRILVTLLGRGAATTIASLAKKTNADAVWHSIRFVIEYSKKAPSGEEVRRNIVRVTKPHEVTRRWLWWDEWDPDIDLNTLKMHITVEGKLADGTGTAFVLSVVDTLADQFCDWMTDAPCTTAD